MVLKRLFVTALSALGLGTLAAGPASAQQIPAPDAYGNAQACSSAFPAAMAGMAPKEHALQDSLDAGALTTVDSNALANEAAPCDVNGAKAGYGDDIADGFELARELYDKAAEAQARVDAAQKVYDDDGSAGNLADLNEAKAKLKVAADARDLYAGVMADGTGGMYVYDNVYKEEAKLAAAQKAITAWTTAVTDAGASQTEVNNVEYGDFVTQFAGFDANGEAREFAYYKVPDDATSGGNEIDDGTVYVQIKGADGKIIAPAMGTGGTYVVPEALDGDGDDDDPVVYVNHAAAFESTGSDFEGGTTAEFQVRTRRTSNSPLARWMSRATMPGPPERRKLRTTSRPRTIGRTTPRRAPRTTRGTT